MNTIDIILEATAKLSSQAIVAQVNKRLKDAGINGVLRKGRGYCYFSGEDFWRGGSVYVYTIDSYTVDEWMEEAEGFLDSDLRGKLRGIK